MTTALPQARTRLDLWLDIACLFKTRSAAQAACRAGRVDVNGQAAKPSRALVAGDVVVISRANDRRQTVVVRGFADSHIARGEARALYEDLTPPPTPQQVEAREMERLFRKSNPRPTSAPSSRTKRAVRRLKEDN